MGPCKGIASTVQAIQNQAVCAHDLRFRESKALAFHVRKANGLCRVRVGGIQDVYILKGFSSLVRSNVKYDTCFGYCLWKAIIGAR